MTNEQAEFIFKPFQSNRDNQLNPKGIGIGLEISKLICKNLGGNITVKTKLNVGSNFTFTMRVYRNCDKGLLEI